MTLSHPEPEIILYGGAFDPPHQGHVDCVQLALERFPEARVIVLPGYQPAGAGDSHKKLSASFKDRVAMCEKAFSGLSPHVSVDELEASLPPPNYTVNTLRHLRSLKPNAHFGFLMGQDQFETFDQWREPSAILELAALVVVTRRLPGAPYSFGELEGPAAELARELKLPAEPTVFVLPGEASDAASHLIRARLAHREALPKDWLPQGVAKYINEQQLYGVEGTQA